jgi:hypothetical protein
LFIFILTGVVKKLREIKKKVLEDSKDELRKLFGGKE